MVAVVVFQEGGKADCVNFHQLRGAIGAELYGHAVSVVCFIGAERPEQPHL